MATSGTGVRRITGFTTTINSVSWSLRLKLWNSLPRIGVLRSPGVEAVLVDELFESRPPMSRAWPSCSLELVRSARV